MLLSARGTSVPVAAEMAKARGPPNQERQAPKARRGCRGHRGGSRGPTCYVQDGQNQTDMNKKVARPAGDVDAPELRKDADLREMAAYMKEAAPKNDSKFDFLHYWEARGTDVVDSSGTVVVPARWPHVGLLVRLYAGIDTTTTCQAKRNFSALK